jgi:hypothetical protein
VIALHGILRREHARSEKLSSYRFLLFVLQGSWAGAPQPNSQLCLLRMVCDYIFTEAPGARRNATGFQVEAPHTLVSKPSENTSLSELLVTV